MNTHKLPVFALRALAGTLFSVFLLPALAPSVRAQITVPNGSMPVSTTADTGLLSLLNFTGVTGTFAIASGANLVFDSLSGSGTDNRLTLPANNSLTFLLANNSSATFSNNKSGAALGAAISVAAGNSRLLFDGRAGTGFIFQNNYSTGNGGVMNVTGAGSYVGVWNALFQSNTAATGGVVNVWTSGSVVMDDVTFTGNRATANGGVFAVTNNAAAYLTATNFLVNSNTAVTGGALFMNNGTAVFSSGTFLNNTMTGAGNGSIAGGAFSGSISNNTNLYAEFDDVSFIGNKSTNASARGGAIGIYGTAVSSTATINLNVSAGNTSYIAGNTYGAGISSGIAVNLVLTTAITLTGNINIFTGTGATLDMLDPFYATVSAGANTNISNVNFTKTGVGIWKLGGDNVFNKATGNGNAAGGSLNINAGTLYLYRAGEQVSVPGLPSPVTAATGNIAFNQSQMATSPFLFHLGGNATLGIGGGNTISFLGTIASNGNKLTFDPGSTLSYDIAAVNLANLASGGSLGVDATSPLFSIKFVSGAVNTNSISIANALYADASAATFNFDLNFDSWAAGSYNLFNVSKTVTTTTATTTTYYLSDTGTMGLGFANGAGTWEQSLLAGITYGAGVTAPVNAPTFSIDSLGNLWITFLANGITGNNVLLWTGATGTSWSDKTNWSVAGANTDFNKGDIINLALVNPASTVSTTIANDVASGATIGAMYVSGNADYTITGNPIIATTDSVGLSFDPANVNFAATGKLIVGGSAASDAIHYATSDTNSAVAYQGTLTLANGTNNFQQGIDIYSGALAGNSANLGAGAPGITIYNGGTLTFDQDASGTYAAPIAGAGRLGKTGAAALTLAADYSAFTGQTAIDAGMLRLAPAAKLGGAIAVNATGTLGGGNAATVLGAVTLNNGAALQVGASGVTASQTFTIGGLTLGAAATDSSLMDFTSLNNQLIVTGAITQTGSSVLNLAATTPGTWQLINVLGAGGITTSNFNTNWLSVTKNGLLLDPSAYTLDITGDWLSIIFAGSANRILTWTGAASRIWDTSAINWNSPGSVPPAVAFTQGDIVNLTAAASGSINVDTGVTLGAMYVSGNGGYILTGSGITTGTTASTVVGVANSGKLVLGQIAVGANTITGTAFTGTLDLTGQTGTNTFTNGVDLYSGALRVSTTDQLGATLNKINFLGSATDATAPATLQIAANTAIAFDSSLTGTENRLVIGGTKSAAFMLESGATLAFSSNTTPAAGGAISVGAGSRLNLDTADGSTASYVFKNNVTTANGGAVSMGNSSTVIMQDVVFRDNVAATGSGGAIALMGNAASRLEVTHFLFDSGTARSGGAVFMNSGTAVFTSGTFLNNVSTIATNTIGGAAFYATTYNATFTDVSFIGNRSTAASSRGGAIGLSPLANSTLNINVTNGTSYFAGNTGVIAGNTISSGISLYLAGAFTENINIFTDAGATLAMLDPIFISVRDAANTVYVNKTGAGTWKLAGDNTIYKLGTSGSEAFNINEGTLYLYRAGEVVNVPGLGLTNTATAAAGNIILSGSPANLNLNFVLAGGANLSVGGGNTISLVATLQAGGPAVTFAQGSILTYDLVSATTNNLGLTTGSPLLTLTSSGSNSKFLIANAASFAAGATTFNFNLNLATWTTGSFNLLAATKGIAQPTPFSYLTATGAAGLGFADGSGSWQQSLLDNLTYEGLIPSIDPTFHLDAAGNLWISFDPAATPLGNAVLAWNGTAGNLFYGLNWTNRPNSRFNQGDIINFDGVTDATGTHAASLTATATVAGIYASGTQTYILTGAGITADATVGTLGTLSATPSPAATGKLILGANAAADGLTAPAYLAYTGTLDLSGLAADKFAAVEIHAGALRVSSNANLGVATLKQLTFTGTGALIIAAGGAVAFDNAYDPAQKLLIGATGTIVSATIAAEPGANLAIARSTNTASGGAIIIAASSTLTLTGAAAGQGGGFLFTSNTTTVEGGVISVAGGAGVIVDSATFTNNASGATGNRNGGAIVGSGAAANLANITVRDSYFANNASGPGSTTTANGGAIAGPYANILVEDSIFASNSAAGAGGAIFNNQAVSITTVNSSTFIGNIARTGGGAISVQTAGKLNVDDSLFQGNIATTGGGGAISALNSTAVNTRNITNTLFISNTARAGNGGAYYTSGSVGVVNFTNVSFLDNTAATGTGGAISIDSSQSTIINITATDNTTSRFAGNTDKNGSNSIFYYAVTPNNAGALNIITGSNATVDMLNPIGAYLSAAGLGLQITKTGSYGTWKLGGDTNIQKVGYNTADPTTFTVSEGTLYLYRAGEQVTDPNTRKTYTAATGNILMTGQNGNLNSALQFTVKSGANLSIGGGNHITYTTSTTSSAFIKFEPGSLLTYDLANYGAVLGTSGVAGSGSALLTLSVENPAIQLSILNGNTLASLLNFTYNDTTLTDGATFNLLTAGAGNLAALNTAGLNTIVQNATYIDSGSALTYLDLRAAGFTATAGVTNDILWITFGTLAAPGNSVLTWAGPASSWSGANWITNAATTADPASFTQADIINLSGSAPSAITVDTLTTATISAMYVSGTASYTLTGASLLALPAIGTLSGSAPANGKLVLGALALDDASGTTATAFTGALTLANTGSNAFTGGIEINSGELVGNDQTLGAGTAGIRNNGTLAFNQTADATYAAPITGNGVLIKTGAATLTLAVNSAANTTAINAGALLLDTGVTLGGAIAVNPTGILGGTGTALGNVTVATTGALQAGLTHGDPATIGPETLAIAGNLALDGGAILKYDLYKNSQSDLITVGGNVTLLALTPGPVTVELSAAPTSGTYALLAAGLALNAASTNFTVTLDTGALSGRTTPTFLINTGTLFLAIANSNTNLTWTGPAAGAWTGANNWNNGVAADTFLPGDNVTIATTGTVTLDSNIIASGMTVNTTGTLALAGAGAIATSTLGTTLAAPPATLTKLGAGVLDLTALTGSNAFTAGINLQAGSIIGSADALGAPAVTTAASATLTIAQATDAAYAANITGAGELVKTLAGNLTLAGTTTYTGPTTVTAGALTLTAANQLASSATITLATGTLLTGANAQLLNELNGSGNITGAGVLTLANATAATVYSGTISGGASITKTGANTLTLAGNNADTGLTISAGTVQLGSGAAAGAVAGPIAIAPNAALALNHGSASGTLANAITGAGLINKLATDTGTLTLTARNSAFTGTTNILGGGLVLANASLGGQLNLSANTSFAGSGTLGGLATLGSSTITVGLTHGVATTPQTLTLTGTLTLAPATTLRFDLYNSGTSDLIAAAGFVHPSSDIIDIAINSSMSGTYTLITAPGVTNANLTTLSNGQTLSGRSVASYVVNGNNLNLVLVTQNAAIVWDGTNGTTWQNNIANWKTSDGKFLDGDSVTFDTTRTGTNLVNIIDTVNVVAMTVTTTASGTYLFTGGAIHVSNTLNSNLAATASGKLTLTATNTGLVILSNTANTFQNGIDILSGTLQGDTTTLNNAPILNNGALIFNQASASGTYTAAITGAGALVKTGTLALTLANAAYAGGLTVSQGALTLQNPGAATQGNIAIASGASLTLAAPGAFAIQNLLTGAGNLSISASGAAVSFSPSAFSPSAFFTGTLALGASTFDLSGANTAALANATLRVNAGNATTVGTGTQQIGNLSINGGLLNFNAGVIRTGTLTLGTSGTIQVALPLAPSLLTGGTSLFAQASGTTLARLVTATASGTVTGAGNVGSLVLVDQNNARVAATGTEAIIQGGATVATGTFGYALNATGGLNVTHGLTALTILPGQTLNLAPAAGDTGTFAATISGSGNLTIDASATTVTLAKSNTGYTGATTLLAGALVASATNAFGGPAATLTQLANTTLSTGSYAQTLATLTTDVSATTRINTAGALTITKGGEIDGALLGVGALNATGGNLAITNANASYTGTTNIGASGTITMGSLQSLGARAIINAGVLNVNTTAGGVLANPVSGAGTLNLNGTGTTTIATANTMTGRVNVNGPVVATTAAAFGAAPITINPTGDLTYTTGTGALANNITGAGTLNLNGGNLLVTGNNNLAGGTINITPGSTISAGNAYALRSTTLNIASNAALVFVANYVQLGNVNMADASAMGFAKSTIPGNSATLASLNVSGTGTLVFNTNVSGVTPLSDRLNVTGQVNGAYNVVLNNTGAVAPNYDGCSLTLVKAAPGGNATFSGSGVFNNIDTVLWDWSVNSADGAVTLDVVRTEALSPLGGAIVANATGVLPLTWFSELDTLTQRLGDLHIAGRSKTGRELWMRAYAQRIDVNNKDTLVPYSETQYGTEVGLDYGGGSNENGVIGYIGAFVGYGSSTRDLNASNSTNADTTSYHAGAYAVLVAPGGWYLDLVGKYNHFKNHFTAIFDDGEPMNGDYTADAFGGSIETGKRIELGRNWYVTPGVQVALTRIDSAHYNTGAPTAALRNTITQEAVSSRQLRAGFLIGKKFVTKDAQVIQPYAKLYAARQWTNGGTITIVGRDSGLPDDHGPYYSTIQGGRVETGLGVNWQLMKALQVYFDYDCAWARDYKKPYGLTLGASYSW